MNDRHPGIVAIYTTKAQINDHFFRRPANLFEQDAGLLELLREEVTVVRIAGERSRSDHQSAGNPRGN